MIRPHLLPLLFACSCAAIAGDAESPVAIRGDWEFSVSAGPAWRQSGTLGFTGGSRSAGVVIPSFVGDKVLVTPPIGASDAIGSRTYDDGFVGTDTSTGIDGLTSYWGYRTAGQVDLPSDSITFRATGFQSIRSDFQNASAAPLEDEPQRGIAPVLQFDARYKQEIAGIRPGFSLFLAWSPVDFDSEWSDFSLGQIRDDFRHDWTDVYNLGGFGALVPSAPYSGAPDSPGFLLQNIADSRNMASVPVGSENALVSNQILNRFSADHTTFSFGPTMSRSLQKDWSIDAGVGVSLHWLHWSASQQEQLSVTQGNTRTVIGEWQDSTSGDRILAGIYLQLALEWKPADFDWSVRSMLRTELGQTFSKQVGPSRITYHTDGLTAAVILSHPL